MTAPVMAMPVVPAAMPAPVPPVPVVVMPVMTPANLLGLEMIDIVLRDDGRFGAVAMRRHQALFRPDRRQRRGLCARSKRGRACNKSKGQF